MSPMRQSRTQQGRSQQQGPYPGVRALLGDGDRFARHQHSIHQLAWARDGALQIDAGDALWLLARGSALWIPAGVAHEVVAEREATMHSLYFAPPRCPLPWTAPVSLHVHGMLGHVLDHLFGLPIGPERARAERFAFDLLLPAPGRQVHVPLPTDDRARVLAAALRSDPADARTLTDWGRVVGASGRTLARVIERETGMSFTEWRTRVRVAHAAQRLLSGERVARVATEVGYASSSAFVAAFRRVVGVTPRTYATAPGTTDDRSRSPGVVVVVGGGTVA
jgi:AraC-like DNA-binding protein